MGAAAVPLLVGPSVIGAGMQYQEDMAAAEIAEQNAKVAEQVAEQALWRGEQEAAKHLMEVGQPAVSRHLRILREAGMVKDVRDGKFVNYRLQRPARTPFGEAALSELLVRLEADKTLRSLSKSALQVDRACL